MSAWHAFHFLRPWWLLGLLALPAIAWWLRRGGEGASLRRLVDAALLPHLLEGGARRRIGLQLAVLGAWTLGTLAMAGPTWERSPQPVFMNQRAQVVAVSLSQRMLAADMTPDRMTRVRYKIHALLQANAAGQNALIAYAGESFTVAPLTSDADALGELLDALAPDVMPVQGDNMASAIRRATRLLQGAGVHDGSIVVIDDHADASAVDAARAARKAGMRVSVLGVGTTKGAPVPQASGGFERGAGGRTLMAVRDDASLRAVAEAGGGRYVPMRNDSADVRALATQLRMRSGARDSHRQSDAWRDRGAWLLLPVLLLAALGFRRGVLWMLPLLIVSWWSPPARASGWQDAWHTRDQQAAKALADGHARKAQQLAHDPALRGTAAYRAGDYRTAAQAFAQAKGAQNLYNRGNALVHMHRYEEAIKAYDQALAADPKLADARANRTAVQDWLRQQRRKQGNGQGEQREQDGHGGQGGQAAPKPGQNGQRKGAAKPSEAGKSASQNGKSSQDATRGDRKSGQGEQHGGAADAQRPDQTTQQPDQRGQTSDQAQKAKAPTAADKQAEQKAQQALKQRMDAQLSKSSRGSQKAYALGAQPEQASGQSHPLPQAMQQALQRVPDDPGGLLRRKFLLEYQRRQQRGDLGGQDDTDGSD